jgi:predicted GTPase
MLEIKFYQCLNRQGTFYGNDIAGTTRDAIDTKFDRFGLNST